MYSDNLFKMSLLRGAWAGVGGPAARILDPLQLTGQVAEHAAMSLAEQGLAIDGGVIKGELDALLFGDVFLGTTPSKWAQILAGAGGQTIPLPTAHNDTLHLLCAARERSVNRVEAFQFEQSRFEGSGGPQVVGLEVGFELFQDGEPEHSRIELGMNAALVYPVDDRIGMMADSRTDNYAAKLQTKGRLMLQYGVLRTINFSTEEAKKGRVQEGLTSVARLTFHETPVSDPQTIDTFAADGVTLWRDFPLRNQKRGKDIYPFPVQLSADSSTTEQDVAGLAMAHREIQRMVLPLVYRPPSV